MTIQTQLSPESDQNNSPITMYYDDACVLCSTEAHNMQLRNPKGIQLISVNEGMDKLEAAGFSRIDAMTYLCVQDAESNWHTHMDAVRLLYKTGDVAWASLLALPIVKQLGDFAYPYVARNRYRIPNWIIKLIYGKAVMQACQNGACQIAPDKR
jgi:predicted DCC family thiol-disulfide oxidoreductase YuxK